MRKFDSAGDKGRRVAVLGLPNMFSFFVGEDERDGLNVSDVGDDVDDTGSDRTVDISDDGGGGANTNCG